MIKNLRRKFVLITMALVSLILLAVFAGIGLYCASTLRQSSTMSLQMALDRPADSKRPNFQFGGPVPEDFHRDLVFVVEVAADGTAMLLHAENIDVAGDEVQKLADLALQQGGKRGELRGYNLRYMVRETPDSPRAAGGATKIAFADLTLERRQLGSLLLVTGLAVAGAFVVFLAASLFLARWALKPVETAWQRQRQFVADASHELKTPLTVILANTGILKAHPQATIAAQMTWVDNTEQEARRMKGLVEDLLFLAKDGGSAEAAPQAPVSLSDVAANAALSFEPVAYEQGLSVEMEVEPGITVTGNEPQLKQLVGILLDNAVKYASPQSVVRLRLKKQQGQAALAVHNQGVPISIEDQGRLFERFYRADPARVEGGYGLGLSIAKAITDGHHGRIEVASGSAGTTFTVLLPLV